MRPFQPIVRNPHLLTIFGNFAKRRLDTARFPVQERIYGTEPGVEVIVHEQRPPESVRGEILLIHGLEGSSNAGYLRSMSQLALEHGYAVHRKNMRSCGGSDALCAFMYHGGLTADAKAILSEIRGRTNAPLFLVGYSLGGNVALKLAGELGEDGPRLLDGVIAVSTPIDLAACVRALHRKENRIYEWRFLLALRKRIRRIHPAASFEGIRSVYQFDDRFVAPYFGFGTADNYYATQSSNQFLPAIRVPTLLVQAKDDPMIPFRVFDDARLRGNPHIELVAAEHGGHLGFLSDSAPRFWVDRVILEWIDKTRNKLERRSVSTT